MPERREARPLSAELDLAVTGRPARTGLAPREQLSRDNPTGTFCYGFYPHEARPEGNGTAYRATAIGTGVTPDVYWEAPALGPYDPAADKIANDEQRVVSVADPGCRPN